MNHRFIPEHHLSGYSIFSSIPITSRLAFFARMDQRMSNTLNNESDAWNRDEDGLALISGFHYAPVEGVSLSLNYQDWNPAVPDMDWLNGINLSFEFRH